MPEPKAMHLKNDNPQGNLRVEKIPDGTFRVFIDFPEERAAFKLSKQQAITIAEFIITNTEEVHHG